MADWQKIKTEYITGNASYRELAQKYGVHRATIGQRAKDEGWVELRRQHTDKTQTKILEADTEEKVDRATKLMTVSDKLLQKVEAYVDGADLISPTSAKNISDALKNIKEVFMVRSLEDIEEQKARIAKLNKEAQQEEKSRDVTIVIEGGEGAWQS